MPPMLWELARASEAVLVELGERAAQLLFYENEGAMLWGEVA